MSTYQNKLSIKVSFINEYKFDIVVTFSSSRNSISKTSIAWTNTFTKILLRELERLTASSGLISCYVLQCGGYGPAQTPAL